MKIINPGYQIMCNVSKDMLKNIEKIARTCYKSEKLITDDSCEKFVAGLIARKHEAMLEHESITIKFICDRGVSHEIVRHRMASFAQESTRYVNYSKDNYNNEITVIKPLFFEEGSEEYNLWKESCELAEKNYMKLTKELGRSPQEARSILPNSTKTELIMTANLREWRHFFKLRAARQTGPAHPQMEEISIPLFKELKSLLPVVFDDIEIP